jgi:outer membrane protein TolC
MAMIWKAEAASKEIGVAKTDFYPNINLAALAGIESLQFPTLFQWSSRTGALQPAIHLPIFTGGKLSANLSSKIAKFNEAVQTYNEGLLEASKEVASELSTLYSLHAQLEMQTKLVGTRNEKELLSLERFERGLDDYLEFLVSRTEKDEEEVRRIALQNMKLLSVVRLIKSLGGGYHAEEIPSLAGRR